MRWAVVADIHGNLPALEAVMDDMAGRRIDRVVNLGDCVSGPLWPRETLDRLMALDWTTLRGNHDRWVASEPPERLSATDAFAAREIGDRRSWLGECPARLDLAEGVIAFHARPDDDDAYLLEDVAGGRLVAATPAEVARRLGGLQGRLMLTAHSHRAAVLRLPDGRWIVNPGSVGCPAYDDPAHPAHVSESGSPSARYAVIEDRGNAAEPDRLSVDLVSVCYDHGGAARRAAALGRPDWAFALASGYAAASALVGQDVKDAP